MKQNDAKRSIKKKLALACFWCVAVVLILGVGYVSISAAQIAADEIGKVSAIPTRTETNIPIKNG